MQIDIDFEVFKALTVRRRDESHSYNEVIRELLGLTQTRQEGSSVGTPTDHERRSFHSRNLVLPHGTLLRAVYKGTTHQARIDDGRWIDEDGDEHSSPSAAAREITGNSVNGLRFWSGRRPGDPGWMTLEILGLLG